MAATSIVAGAVAVGLAFYILSGILVMLFAQLEIPQGASEDERRVARYHALTVSYTAGWRKAGLALALVAYGAAAVDLFQADATALAWLCAAVGLDCILFLAWRDRTAFMASLSPQERMSDASGVAALALALAVTATLRFSGALA